MTDDLSTPSDGAAATSPPPAPLAQVRATDAQQQADAPRRELQRLADALRGAHDRRLMVEFLRLRRAAVAGALVAGALA